MSKIFALERPNPALWTLYIIHALLTGPFVIISLPLYCFRYRTLRYRFDEEGIHIYFRWVRCPEHSFAPRGTRPEYASLPSARESIGILTQPFAGTLSRPRAPTELPQAHLSSKTCVSATPSPT